MDKPPLSIRSPSSTTISSFLPVTPMTQRLRSPPQPLVSRSDVYLLPRRRYLYPTRYLFSIRVDILSDKDSHFVPLCDKRDYRYKRITLLNSSHSYLYNNFLPSSTTEPSTSTVEQQLVVPGSTNLW